MTRYICQSCDEIIDADDLLTAPHPFREGETIDGCPKCRECEGFWYCCDEPGCPRKATCGFPTVYGGYRRTCARHYEPEE